MKNKDGKTIFLSLWVAAYFKGHQSKQKEKTVNLYKSKSDNCLYFHMEEGEKGFL